MPRKTLAAELQEEEVGSSLRRSSRITSSTSTGQSTASITTRRTSQTESASDVPEKITKARRPSTTQENDDKVDVKPVSRARRASILAEEEQKETISTPTRRGRRPSVTAEPTDSKETEKPKPVRGRRGSATETKEYPEENSQKAATVRTRRGSSNVDTETDVKSAPKTPARAVTRRRSSATENAITEIIEVAEPAKRITRGRKASDAKELAEDPVQKPVTGRRKSVTDTDEPVKKEATKPATRGRKASTDEDAATTAVAKTPGRSRRRTSVNKEADSEEVEKENNQKEEGEFKDKDENELSPIILKETAVKLTPIKKRKILEPVVAELDLSVINESIDDNEASKHEDESESKNHVQEKSEFMEDKVNVDSGLRAVANEIKGESLVVTNNATLTISPELKLKMARNEIAIESSVINNKVSPSALNMTELDTPKSKKSLENPVEESHAIESNSPKRKRSISPGVKETSDSPKERSGKKRLSPLTDTNLTPRKSPRLSEKLSRNNTPEKGSTTKISPRTINLFENKDEENFNKKNTSCISTGSDGSFRFHLSNVSLPNTTIGHHESHKDTDDDVLNSSKESGGSNKENINSPELKTLLNKSELANKVQEIIPQSTTVMMTRVSNVFKPNQKEYSFVELMEVDEYSMIENSVATRSPKLNEVSNDTAKALTVSKDSEESGNPNLEKYHINESAEVSLKQSEEISESVLTTEISDLAEDGTKQSISEEKLSLETTVAEKSISSVVEKNDTSTAKDYLDNVKIVLTRKSSSPVTTKRKSLSLKKSGSPVYVENKSNIDAYVDNEDNYNNLKLGDRRRSKSKSNSPSPRSVTSPSVIYSNGKHEIKARKSNSPFNQDPDSLNPQILSKSISPIHHIEEELNISEKLKEVDELVVLNDCKTLDSVKTRDTEDMSNKEIQLNSVSIDQTESASKSKSPEPEVTKEEPDSVNHLVEMETNSKETFLQNDVKVICDSVTADAGTQSKVTNQESTHYDFDIPSDDDDLKEIDNFKKVIEESIDKDSEIEDNIEKVNVLREEQKCIKKNSLSPEGDSKRITTLDKNEHNQKELESDGQSKEHVLEEQIDGMPEDIVEDSGNPELSQCSSIESKSSAEKEVSLKELDKNELTKESIDNEDENKKIEKKHIETEESNKIHLEHQEDETISKEELKASDESLKGDTEKVSHKKKTKKSEKQKHLDKESSVLDESTTKKGDKKENIVNEAVKNKRQSLEDFAQSKLDEYIKSKVAELEAESSSEDESESEYNEFIDGMAEEGEEDTPSEDSNQIIDEGESIGSSDSAEFSEEDYENDSFVCEDEEPLELLSGEEYDLGQDKTEKKFKKSRIIKLDAFDDNDIIKIARNKKAEDTPKKKSRIITIIDSSEDEEDKSIFKNDAKPSEDVCNVEQMEEFLEKSQPVILIEESKDEESDLNSILETTSDVLDTSKQKDRNSRKRSNSESNVLLEESNKKMFKEQSDLNTSSLINQDASSLKMHEQQNKPSIQNSSDVDITTTLVQEEMKNEPSLNTSVQRKHRKSSLTIHENILLDGSKDKMISKRINSLVESFCSTVKKGEIALNLSLEFEDSDETQSKIGDQNVMVLSDIKISSANDELEQDFDEGKPRLSVSMDNVADNQDIPENRILKRRLSKSADDINEDIKTEKKKRKKKNKKKKPIDNSEAIDKMANDLHASSFSLMNQLITDVKSRPKRRIKPTIAQDDDNMWVTDKVKNLKPSKCPVSRTEKIITKVETKFHPKDFKNIMLADGRRVKRVETKDLLKKRGMFY